MLGNKQLPLELLTLVASSASPSAQAALCRTSKAINQVVTPILYRNIVVTRANADKLFLGLPRSAKAKGPRCTKAEFDREIEQFRAEHQDIWEEVEEEGFDHSTGNGFQAFDYEDSDPETDDELIPELESVKNDTKLVSWERRRELFKHVRKITFAQTPSTPFMDDLIKHLDVRSRFDSEEDAKPLVPLFPSLTHLSVSSRVIRYVADWASVNFYESETEHPLMRIIGSKKFGEPVHACMTMPNDRDMPEFFRRMIKRRLDNINEKILRDFGPELQDSWEVVRTDPAVSLYMNLPLGLKSVTIHDLRYVGDAYQLHARQGTTDAGFGVPLVQATNAKVKAFYNPKEDSVAIEPAVAWIAQAAISEDPARSQSWEFVGNISLKRISSIKKQITANAAASHANVDRYGFVFLPEDENAEAEAALAAAVGALEEAKALVEQALRDAEVEYDEAIQRKAPELPGRIAELEAEAAAISAKWKEANTAWRNTRHKERNENKRIMDDLNRRRDLANNAAKGVGASGAEVKALWKKAGVCARKDYLQTHRVVKQRKAEVTRRESDVRRLRGEAGARKKQNARKRLAKQEFFNPFSRIAFTSFDDADPCEVCGGTNVVDGDLKELLDRAWSKRI